VKAEEIKQYLAELNDELRAMDVKGEICLYGGAVMCLVYDARPATKDVDAIFRPAEQIRQAAERVAQAHDLRGNWLNDAVKGFLVPHAQRILFDFSHLKIYVPEPEYLLAMKALAARVDETDRGDLELLIKLLELKTPDEVFAILEKYYPRRQIKPATQFFVEELFGQ
jgi:hypothetical protein